MVENYTKDSKESVYHDAVISILALGYTMLGKTLIKMSPPSLINALAFTGVIFCLVVYPKNQLIKSEKDMIKQLKICNELKQNRLRKDKIDWITLIIK